ncbi:MULTISPECIES: DMT family transporter [unclassified Clostridium]|uniref:DMT family transporter n=2 Tax=Clostridium TaxID=1485 RepID=UPI00215ABE90|nr:MULTISPECIES: DMT family transporter [unclassified Clostridium]WAG69009.1 DMT family transporter [Clostridium sp. CF011]
MGLIFSIVAGICMSLQGVFNTRVSEKVGLWETNVFVQGTGFIVTLIILLIVGNGNIKAIKEVNKLYLLGGFLGAIIIFSVMQGISIMGPTCSIAIILVAQLLAAGVIDRFGMFGAQQIKFALSKFIGIGIMIVGIIIFKWKF